MSQGPYSASDNDEISLAVQFQGLSISIQGPAAKALAFARKLSPEPEAEPAVARSSQPSVVQVVDTTAQCPDQYLALASKLSAASSHSPLERVRRAWTAGLLAKAELAGHTPGTEVVDLDLPSSYFVVLRGRRVVEPKVLRSKREYKDLAECSVACGFIGHGFPSETESRVYLAAAGRASRHGA